MNVDFWLLMPRYRKLQHQPGEKQNLTQLREGQLLICGATASAVFCRGPSSEVAETLLNRTE